MLVLQLVVAALSVVNSLKVGTGISDITGPSVEINFMGYAVPGQRGSGIHTRLWSRAFVFADDAESGKHVAFVSVDGGMGSDLVKKRVLEKLDAELGNGVYTYDNLAISGTHTHSGPAGFLQYVLFQVTSLGYVKETMDTWVDAISQSVLAAHNNLQDGTVELSQGELYSSNINRSPTSYLLNPEEERAMYPEGDTDKNMMLLNLKSAKSGASLGVLNWFAVHGTSMNNTNTLTSGDNRGYASYMMEKDINGIHSSPGSGPFIAAFASSNLGDVSPNTNGAKCIDTGEPCEGTTSSCNGKCEKCIAFGPGTNGDMFESTSIIGGKQYEHALSLMEAPQATLKGSVDYRHSFIDMSALPVTLKDGTTTKTCSPAMGYSFAAGTTDGPGMFKFTQGTTTGNPFWDKVRDFLAEPTEEEIACQAPKPILLNTGDIAIPYEWDPRIVPVQILRVGNLYILSAPSEFTTMAGRRLRSTIRSILQDGAKARGEDPSEIFVTISGLTNTYSSYTTTYEEYQAQRYEAASTLYGPHTLEGYIQEFSRLARDLVSGNPSTTGPAPPDLSDVMIQLMPEAKFDRLPRVKDNSTLRFGDVVEGRDAKESYEVGETVSVTFHAANPRNNMRLQGTYMTVERLFQPMHAENRTPLVIAPEELQQEQHHWRTGHNQKTPHGFVIATDGDWSTRFDWRAGPEDPLDLGLSKISMATLNWTIPEPSTDPRVLLKTTELNPAYRVCYHGDHKLSKESKVIPFKGCSSAFTITHSSQEHLSAHLLEQRRERERREEQQ